MQNKPWSLWPQALVGSAKRGLSFCLGLSLLFVWHCPAPVSVPEETKPTKDASASDVATQVDQGRDGVVTPKPESSVETPQVQDDTPLDQSQADIRSETPGTPDQATKDVGAPEQQAEAKDTCANGTQDPGETNVDCDGTCPACVSTITRFGITWTFDKGYRTGKFANGDDWVLGPVKLIGIAPLPKDGLHGFEINPRQNKQPFDKRSTGYDASLMPAVPTANKPLSVPEGSIVSTISNTPLKSKCNNRDNYWPSALEGCTRSHLKSAAILTVLKQIPPPRSFRPPYMGTDKGTKHTVADLDMSKLEKLAPVAGVPGIAGLERHFERPWLDHIRGWAGAFLHPGDNMHNYGREISKRIGDAALMLQLDFSKLPNTPSKEKLLIRFVQLGIDLAGMIANGQAWPHDGGHGLGRKLPILFAGTLLNDKTILAAGAARTAAVCVYGKSGEKGASFQEDSATFYVSSAEVQISASSKWNPDSRATPRKYTTKDIGIPEWGIRHTCQPTRDNFHWSATYRPINGAGYAGFVLTAHLMGLHTQWAHPALFDFTDRWAEITGDSTGTNSWNKFHLEMWKKYRDRGGCRWTRDDKANTYSQGHYTCGGKLVACTWQSSSCKGCTQAKACSDYPDQRSRNYDPCQLKCP